MIQHFEADFLWKVSLKILISGITLKTFPHVTVFLEDFFEKYNFEKKSDDKKKREKVLFPLFQG